MSKKLMLIGIFFISILLFMGCSMIIEKSEEESKDEESEIVDSEENEKQEPIEEIDQVKEKLKSMSLEEKIGQMIIAGIDGFEINDQARNMIEKNHLGGFILYGSNISDSSQLLNLVNSLKKTNQGYDIPLFISVDEEGGKVSRMPKEFKKFPTNKEIGRLYNREFSYEIGRIIAEEISSFGFNMNYAPVLDINSNPKNPVIGDRSFGAEVAIVKDLGISTMKGIQSGGVISVIKHFPGHGDTSVDSHLDLPLVDSDLARLVSFEMVPFDAAIKDGADAIMVAHILLIKIDPENPATLSKTVISEILRRQLDFQGVVITDDMTMGAIAKNYSIEDAAIKSVNAGSDIILVAHEYEKQIAVINGLINSVKNGIIPETRIDESVYRILKLKAKYNVSDNINDPVNIEEINNKIESILEELGQS